MLLAFRREQCAEDVRTFRLRGLEPERRYRITNMDTEAVYEASGRELMEQGARAVTTKPRESVLLLYRLI